ncbi:MAG: hypothetical protein ACE5Q6_06925 [Dehalococcoidia bacterium]
MRNSTETDEVRDLRLEDHLLGECVAMAKYAFASGLKVPAGLVQTLEDITNEDIARRNGANGGVIGPEAVGIEDVGQPPESPGQRDRVKTLASIHSRLADILSPASPRTVMLLESESRVKGFWGFLGPVALIRRMMFLAIVFLVALIAIGVTPLVNSQSINAGIFNSSGTELLLNLLFLLAAAGLGACFAGLFQANRYIANSTFDPKYESSYWIRIVLGLMAGIILAELIPVDLLGGGGAEGGGASSTQALVKPVLALLGGFSAAAVYRIIARMVDSLESLVRGDTKTMTQDMLVAQGQASKAQLEASLATNRLNLAASLTKLQQKLGPDANPEEIRQELDKVLGSLIPTDPLDNENT